MGGCIRGTMAREALAERFRALNARACASGAELEAVLLEQVATSVDMASAALLEELAGALERLVGNTPMDTGRARAGWFVSAEVSEDVPPEDAAGMAAFAASRVFDAAAAMDADAIYIINNLDYLPKLEAGWSQDQPGGFIALFVVELRAGLERRARGM